MWTIPHEAAGEIGWQFKDVNVYPIPRIGIIEKPKSEIPMHRKGLFPDMRDNTKIKVIREHEVKIRR